MFRVTLIFNTLLGFLFPIAIAAIIIPFAFQDPAKKFLSGTTISEEISEGDQLPIEADVQGNNPTLSIASNISLDPKQNHVFLVSFLLKLKALPIVGVRHNIIEKYQGSAKIHSGWALGIKTNQVTSRFEVYWVDTRGKGGWFTFDNYHIQLGDWYALSLVAFPNKTLGLYIQPIKLSELEDFIESNIEESNKDQKVTFLGGYQIDELGLPFSTDDLKIGVIRQNEKEFKGEVRQLIVGNISTFSTNIDDVRKALIGGPSKFVSSINPDEISLWMRQPGKDESRYKRDIKF